MINILLKNLKKLQKKESLIILLAIFVIGYFFRAFNLSWDNGGYFHPDERAIAMFVSPIHLPVSWDQFFSIESPLNFKFFAYFHMPKYWLLLAKCNIQVKAIF